MNTGKTDINKLGVIEKLNGKDHFDYWSTEECNRYFELNEKRYIEYYIRIVSEYQLPMGVFILQNLSRRRGPFKYSYLRCAGLYLWSIKEKALFWTTKYRLIGTNFQSTSWILWRKGRRTNATAA